MILSEEEIMYVTHKLVIVAEERARLRDALQNIIATWNDPNLDAGETAAEMATIAQQALNQGPH